MLKFLIMRSVLRELKLTVIDFYNNIIGLIKNITHDFGPTEAVGRVVVFVPGYTVVHNPPRRVLVDALRAEGFGVATFNPGRTIHRDIRHLAEDLGHFVEEVRRRTGASTVVLVAHSMGGLVAKYYLQKLGGHRAISKLIALGAPFAGTRVAYVGAHTRAARQMIPGSKFLLEFSKDAQYLDRIISIRGRRDQFIKPKSSSFLPGAKNIEIPVVGHNSMRDSQEVIDAVKKELI